jgi:pimeloyl-ACP methyl ester carboxylesterase
MAQDTITFIEAVIGQPVYLLGCSDGAIVALMVALRRPDLVRRLVFAAGSSTATAGPKVSSTVRRQASSGRATERSHPTESPTTT